MPGGKTLNDSLISVIIPLYNHEIYIRQAIQSVLAQTYGNFELIIINDGSTDNSEGVVKGIADSRIRYYSQENAGAPAAINRGISLAGGEYVSILNSDDVYDTVRLEECVRILSSDRSLSAVFSHLEFIDKEGRFIKYVRGPEENWLNHSPETSFVGENDIVLDLLAGNFLTTTSNLFCRKDAFDSIGHFSGLRYAHDYEFFLRLCSSMKSRVIDKPLLKYRIHDSNTIREHEAAVNFEVGLVLTDFLLRADLRLPHGSGEELEKTMMRFINSVNTYNADRMIMTLMLFRMKYPEIGKACAEGLMKTPESPFRKACISSIQKQIDDWQASNDLWKKYNDVCGMYGEASEEAKKWWLNSQEAWHLVGQKDEELGQKDRELGQKDKELATALEEAKKWWLNSQEAWHLVDESGRRLHEKEDALALKEKNLWETTARLEAVMNSRSFRLGRVITWPWRKILGRT